MTMVKRVKLPNHYERAQSAAYGGGRARYYITLPDPLDPPKRERVAPEIGREVAWLEDGRELRGQVWDVCANRTNREQCHVGQLWWVVVAPECSSFAGELRVASFGSGVSVGYWQHTPGGRCVREGKSLAVAA